MKMLKYIINLLSILIVLNTFLTYNTKCENPEGPLENDSDYFDNLQKGRTRRMIWLDKRRRLILPPDTSLSITPILAFPVFKQSTAWVSFENFQLQWTFFILFQGLGWTSEEHAWPMDISFLIPGEKLKKKKKGEKLIPNMTSEAEASSSADSTRRHSRNNYCQKFTNRNGPRPRQCEQESIPVMALPPHIPGGERASIFPNLEKFLESFGINGRACLQRVVCEVHEIPLKNGFGLFGEFLTLLFSVSQSIYANSHLPGYLRAELAGKFGDCTPYHHNCPYSIFTPQL